MNVTKNAEHRLDPLDRPRDGPGPGVAVVLRAHAIAHAVRGRVGHHDVGSDRNRLVRLLDPKRGVGKAVNSCIRVAVRRRHLGTNG